MSRRPQVSTVLTACLLAALGLLAGCGSSPPEPEPATWSVLKAKQTLASISSQEKAQAAWDYLKAEANNGNAEAMYVMAEEFGRGEVVPADPKAMAKWLGLSAKAGHAPAQTDLALLVLTNAGTGEVSGEQVFQAMALLEAAGHQDEPRALDQLGRLHASSARDVYDLSKAQQYFQRASDLGYAPSKVHLATFYFTGKGVDRDVDKGVALLTEAANAGQTEAALRLAELYSTQGAVKTDLNTSRKWLEKAATSREPRAIRQLAEFYLVHHSKDTDLQSKALQMLNQTASAGDVASQELLARAYLTGRGGSANLNMAARWFQQAAEQGSPSAKTALALLIKAGNAEDADQKATQLLSEAAEAGDPRAQYILYKKTVSELKPGQPLPKKALGHLQAAAKGQVPQAQYELGERLMSGNGVKQDGAAAYQLFKLAGAKGHVQSLRMMGQMFREGGTLTQDPDKALALLELAANNGDAEAALEAGLLLKDSDDAEKAKHARRYFKLAADKGIASAKGHLGQMLLTNRGGAPNPAEALRLLREAQAQKDPQASFMLAEIYDYGLAGQKSDPAKAASHYREAQSQGNDEASFRLVKLIEQHGDRVGNRDEATSLLRKLVRDGYPGAATLLGEWQLNGKMTRKDLYSALRTFQRGAQNGEAGCLYHLGLLYESGQGVEADPIRAAKYYRQAAEQNHAGALNNLGVMYMHGYGVGKNRQKARELLTKAKQAGHPQAAANLRQIP